MRSEDKIISQNWLIWIILRLTTHMPKPCTFKFMIQNRRDLKWSLWITTYPMPTLSQHSLYTFRSLSDTWLWSKIYLNCIKNIQGWSFSIEFLFYTYDVDVWAKMLYFQIHQQKKNILGQNIINAILRWIFLYRELKSCIKISDI